MGLRLARKAGRDVFACWPREAKAKAKPVQSKTVRAHRETEEERRVRGGGKRDARSGQTGVTGRYPLVACGKGRTRYCCCAFLHPSRTVLSALLQAASDSQISLLASGHSHVGDRFASILDDRIQSRGKRLLAFGKAVHVASFYDEVIL